MRIKTNLTESDKEKINDYAKEKGWRLGKTYTYLIREGLKRVKQREGEVAVK